MVILLTSQYLYSSIHVNSTLQFWKKWQAEITTKPENSLTLIDCRLRKFLKRISTGEENIEKQEVDQKEAKKKKRSLLTLNEVNRQLQSIEEEKMRIKLDLDELDFKILKYKQTLKQMEHTMAEKRKRNRELIAMKHQLNDKKRKIEERESNKTMSIIEAEN